MKEKGGRGGGGRRGIGRGREGWEDERSWLGGVGRERETERLGEIRRFETPALISHYHSYQVPHKQTRPFIPSWYTSYLLQY